MAEAFWVSELVREKLLAVARDELPHSIACRVTEWEWPRSRCEILVERESQKGIVVGRAGDKIRVVAEVNGLTPGAHGFHIHEKGDCSAPDGTSAGGHFNPGARPHGNPEHADHHAGDMPQLIANAAGVATLTAYLDGVSLGDEANGIVGRSVIVHAAPDDFKTQPTGNSGARLACGVIVRK